MVERAKKNEVEAAYSLTIQEVLVSFGIEKNFLLEILAEGILDLPADDRGELHFHAQDLRTIRTVLSLHRDLGINMPGAALALDLMRELEQLRRLLSQS